MTLDFSKPVTAEDIEALKTVFRGLPTFSNEGYILTSDSAELCRGIGYHQSAEQLDVINAYYNKHFGGIITLSRFVDGLQNIHDVGGIAKHFSVAYDKDKDGFISKDEFQDFKEIMISHEPHLAGKDFDTFLKEADANKDGKVSVEEFSVWIKSNFKS